LGAPPCSGFSVFEWGSAGRSSVPDGYVSVDGTLLRADPELIVGA
jgi:hypothetical protein